MNELSRPDNGSGASVSLLNAGKCPSYALGLAAEFVAAGIRFDFVGGEEAGTLARLGSPQVKALNLRGDQSADAGFRQKMLRILAYYGRLIRYAAAAKPEVFHIMWNNKFEFFDRTVLMLYYKLLGKKIVLTAHNVNAGKRDGHDSFLNRLTLKIQYRLCDHIFVHTARMQAELLGDFGVRESRTSIIPHGVNHTVPDTKLTGAAARRQLNLGERDKVILFFGYIAPYKGLEFLVAAFAELAREDKSYRLIIAGEPKSPKDRDYWRRIQETIARSPVSSQVTQKIEYIPDADTELYFKSADVLVLPYIHIFQSGVLFLSYSFGLPVIAADVGALREEIIADKTGLVFEAKNVPQLAQMLQKYFGGDLRRDLDRRRQDIRDYADEKYSWKKIAALTTTVYARLCGGETS
jgi:glycosyltransferase involved in cell wall biosynthesis